MTTPRLEHALTIVLPVYNETHRAEPSARRLLDLVRTLPEGSRLVFVDDGSTDGTAELLEKLLVEHDVDGHATVLRRPHRGKGAATRAGLLTATTPLVGFCDIDLATPIPSFLEVAATAARSPVLAIGSRDVVGSRVLRSESHLRELLGRTYNRVVQSLVAPGIIDTQCGAKVARREVWASILPASREDGFAWDVEICGLALAAGQPVVEVAIDWVHDDGSNINVALDGFRMVAALPRIRRTTRRFARTQRRRAGRRWQDRSTAAIVASLLRSHAPEPGPLVALGGDGAVASALGWSPRDVVLVTDRPPRRAQPITVVTGSPDDPPLAPGRAAVVLVTHRPLDLHRAGVAADLLRPDGLLIVVDPAARPRDLGARARAAGLRIERETPVFAWTTVAGLATGRGRGSLLWTALERLAIARLGWRMPRGAAALVVARRIPPS